jgi:DNA ligase-1
MTYRLFSELAHLCERLEKTAKRLEKVSLISSFLSKLEEKEIAPAVLLLTGNVFPESDGRVLNVGYRAIEEAAKGSKQAALIQSPLTIIGVYKYLEEVANFSGVGSKTKRENLVKSLLSQADEHEAKYIVRILLGEMRVGVLEKTMLEAIAEAAKVDRELVRRSHMLLGDLGEVARIALKEGASGLKKVSVQIFKPIKPMLAEMSYNLAEVFAEYGGKVAFEYKFDGARIQIHKRNGEVRVFSRRLTDVTESLPDIVELARRKVNFNEGILEGEVVAVGLNGKPLPFQDLMRRFRRVHDVDQKVKEVPLKLYLFDILYIDGRSLIDTAYNERWSLLSQVCDSSLLAPRIVTGNISEAEEFLKEAVKAGHEGLMAKSLSSFYTPGVRGKKWFKIKPFERLDLVIAAADWGHGRRVGWLSNYYLAARNDRTGEFLVVGKTFKGLTDEEFAEITERLRKIKISEDECTVYVKPEIVVEVAYNEIQRSPRYDSGFALRFARITRVRDDKSPQDADTIGRIKELYERQFEHKARTIF